MCDQPVDVVPEFTTEPDPTLVPPGRPARRAQERRNRALVGRERIGREEAFAVIAVGLLDRLQPDRDRDIEAVALDRRETVERFVALQHERSDVCLEQVSEGVGLLRRGMPNVRASNGLRILAGFDHQNVGMAVLNDVGEVRDTHPRNKIAPGKRLARWALAKTYGDKDLVYSGPLYSSHNISNGKVTIKFDSVGDGLMTGRKNLHWGVKAVEEELGGFQICGPDRKWKWAKARISGTDTVEVWHPEVTQPDEVRYAWAQNPANANLYNKSGLPTSLFSTK